MSDATDSSTFDYVIIGGGTAGLVLAARLSETEDITVCVIEAGEDVSNHKEVLTPGLAPKIWEKQTNWGFDTIPQKHANGKVIHVNRGKGLGGSSMSNQMQLNRAPAHEYDALEIIGNMGWNSSEFLKYFIKSQSLAYDQDRVDELELKPNNNEFGSGPVFNSLSRYKTTYGSGWIKAFEEEGVPFNPNAMGGDSMGTWWASLSIHPETATRISSATAYYEPNKHRKNLKVVTGAHVVRILFKNSSLSVHKPVAEGVDYQKGGREHTVSARREVILAAGAIQTPQILELSGIGQKSLLDKFSIPTITDLPGVGENCRECFSEDQPAILMVYELKPHHESYDVLKIDLNRAEEEERKFVENREGMLTSIPGLYAILPLEKLGNAQTFWDYVSRRTWNKIPEAVLKLQTDWLMSEDSPQMEYYVLPFFWPTAPKPESDPGKQYISVIAILLHPFNRGTVHIRSPDPFVHPGIDFSIFDNEFDLGVLMQGVNYFRKVIAKTDAFKDMIEKEVAPASHGDTDEDLIKYLKGGITTAFHPLGTAAMMKKDEGGVVNERLEVYGVERLRIVDASILPFQPGAHTQASIYAIAEKAADLIKEDTAR